MTRDDPAAFVPPPAFGPFRVLHQIGIGALGPVFRTYEPTRDRLVAVKVFRLDVTPEQAHALALELSRAADAGLFHPSIVEPISAGVEGASAFRAEEYVAAESLDVAIRHYAPAPLDRVMPFLTQLAGAIDFARAAGVGHGGLHLRDVFMTPDEARASGFGIVEALERVGVRAPVRRPYSAPERIAGEPWSTPADVFSLAAIAYELLTGRRPAGTGDQIGELAGEHIAANPAALRAVLARAMDDDPARRYSSALGFASALEDAAHTPVPVPTVVAPAVVPTANTSDVAKEPGPSPAEAPDLELEPPADDIVAEREADAADHLLTNEEATSQPGPTLFDDADDEAAADLGLDDVAVAADDSTRWKYDRPGEQPSLVADAEEHVDSSYRERDYASPITDSDVMPPPVERARPGILPMALMLIVGLLFGFAVAWALLSRDAATPAKQDTVESPATPPASPPPATNQSQPAAARAYSEQSVSPASAATTPRSGEAPPVPGDDPSAADASSAKRATSPAMGQLKVVSTPTRAGVTVNGHWRGRTPLTLDGLVLGSYNVRVVQPGFSVSTEDVTLSERQPAQSISVHLQPVGSRSTAGAASAARVPLGSRAGARATPPSRAPAGATFAGSIYVDSRPRGATILLDGRARGTTPASIPDVPIGSHVVRLELSDHRAWSTSTRVAAGEQSRVTGSLELLR